MDLRVGEKTAIRLPGRAMSGYRWTAHVSGDAVIVSVSPAPREEIDGRPPGAGADEIATVEALRPGRATVTLELRRSWENAPQPQDRRIFEVTVA